MRKLLTVILLVTVIGVFVLPANAQVLGRSAKTMKQGSYIVMAHFYHMNFTQTWDTSDEEWVDYDHTKIEYGVNPMFGYAVTDRMEWMINVPFRNINYESEDGTVEKSAMGVGDIWLKTRIAILPWAKDKHGLTFLSTLSLPTGTKYQEIALGSGRLKWALGGIISTKWFDKFRGHLKLNYWFDQKGWYSGSNTTASEQVVVGADTTDQSYLTMISANNKDVGDNMKIIVKLDYNFHKKFMGFATYIHTRKWKDRTAPGVITPNTHKIRHIAQVGGVYKPKKGVFIRPKVAFTVGGEVGLAYTFKPMLDLWYVFTI